MYSDIGRQPSIQTLRRKPNHTNEFWQTEYAAIGISASWLLGIFTAIISTTNIRSITKAAIQSQVSPHAMDVSVGAQNLETVLSHQIGLVMTVMNQAMRRNGVLSVLMWIMDVWYLCMTSHRAAIPTLQLFRSIYAQIASTVAMCAEVNAISLNSA